MALVVDEIKPAYVGRVTFVDLGVDDPDEKRQAEAIGLIGHPAIALSDRKGNVVWRRHGVISVAVLRKQIDAILS